MVGLFVYKAVGDKWLHKTDKEEKETEEISSDQTRTFFFFFGVPQLYLWGSPLLGEIFACVTVFLIQPLR